ncbi:MAG: BON domain-containing protein [Rhodoferax sp.]|nr:BON domain-containing protein [Rhodoferax sp.]
MNTNASIPLAARSGRPSGALLNATRFDPAAQDDVVTVPGLPTIDDGLPRATVLADTDIAILAEDVLRAATYLPLDVVRVRVDGGWVTLTGELDWKYQKQAAARAVADLRCVMGVTDRIMIRPKVSTGWSATPG